MDQLNGGGVFESQYYSYSEPLYDPLRVKTLRLRRGVCQMKKRGFQ